MWAIDSVFFLSMLTVLYGSWGLPSDIHGFMSSRLIPNEVHFTIIVSCHKVGDANGAWNDLNEREPS